MYAIKTGHRQLLLNRISCTNSILEWIGVEAKSDQLGHLSLGKDDTSVKHEIIIFDDCKPRLELEITALKAVLAIVLNDFLCVLSTIHSISLLSPSTQKGYFWNHFKLEWLSKVFWHLENRCLKTNCIIGFLVISLCFNLFIMLSKYTEYCYDPVNQSVKNIFFYFFKTL